MTGVLVSQAALAIALGGALAAGVYLVISALPRWRAPATVVRIGPYVQDVAAARGLLGPRGVEASAGHRALERAVALLAAALGGDEVVRVRLAQAGWSIDVRRFRIQQLVAALAGGAIGAVVTSIVWLTAGNAAAVVVVPIGAVLGALAWDGLLQRRAGARRARLREELPEVLEFLGMCLAAGEGLLGAIGRVGEIGAGELTRHLRHVSTAVAAGGSLGEELGALASSLQLPELSRATDQLVASLERGAPLVQVLQAQAVDAREASRRGLMERAGRAEIVMLLPLVFFILPVSVLFAIYPGVFLLRSGLG